MNNLEFELLNGYLEQLSFKTQNTINELQLVKRHIDGFKSQLTKRDISEQTRVTIPEQKLSIEQTQIREKQASDLIRIKEVMSMTGLSKSSIYTYKSKGEFPNSIQLSSRSVAWVRVDVEQWILDKINNR
jgi:prophage regulatory protein